MSGSLTVALRAAQSGLLSTQSAVDAVAKNIANANTEGYSRKIVSFENRVLAGTGSGVQLSAFTRAIDEGLLKDLRRELSETSALDAQVSYFDRIQNLFGSPGDNSSISHILSQLHQAAESLALSPEKTLEQNEFVRFAEEVALKLQSMTESIQALRAQADNEIENVVNEINTYTNEIADANDKIIRNEAITNDVTDLKDKRDLALKRLSALIETTTFPRNNGDLVVFTASGFSLVDRTANEMTHTAVGNLTTSSTYASGNLTGVFLGGEAADNDITNRVTGGALSALIKQRDDVLPNLQSQLDELATELRDAVNAVHNRGTTYPGLQSMSGNRKFIDADAQTITLDPTNSTDDVTIAMFDSSGLQLQSTTLNTIMMAGEYGTGIQSDHGPWTITEVAATVEDWLQANGASSATVGISSSTGKMDISLNDSTVYMAFRDEVATAEGSAAGDAEIGFDSDADGDVDETVSGFSSFFRLNDLYVDDTNGALLESVQLSDNFSSSVSTLTFYDGTAGVGSGNALGSVSFTKNQSLTSMVKSINDASLGITASITPDGSGSRLRLLHDAGLELVVTQGSSDSILEATGLAPSNSRSATSIAVRDDIAATPGLVTTAQMQFDTTKGRYMINAGDNTIIQDLAEMLSAKNVFDAAGGLNGATRTFEEFSIDILSRQANLADTNESQLATQLGLTESLELEASRISGVNMDEEMANLIVYQQSFSAAARVISVIQEMFKTLEQAVG